MAYKNTGRVRVRETWLRRRIVLQVEQRDNFYSHWYRWRDARLADLQELPWADAIVPVVQNLRLVK